MEGFRTQEPSLLMYLAEIHQCIETNRYNMKLYQTGPERGIHSINKQKHKHAQARIPERQRVITPNQVFFMCADEENELSDYKFY